MKSALGVILIGPNDEAARQELHGSSLIARAWRTLELAGLPVVAVPTLDELSQVEDVLVIHDPLQVMVNPTTVRSVMEVVSYTIPAAVAVNTVTDTVKQVDEAGAVVGEVDRDAIKTVTGPVALWVDAIPALPNAEKLEDIVVALQGRIIQLSVPGPTIRADSTQALRMAEAMLTPRQPADDSQGLAIR